MYLCFWYAPSSHSYSQRSSFPRVLFVYPPCQPARFTRIVHLVRLALNLIRLVYLTYFSYQVRLNCPAYPLSLEILLVHRKKELGFDLSVPFFSPVSSFGTTQILRSMNSMLNEIYWKSMRIFDTFLGGTWHTGNSAKILLHSVFIVFVN